jgi:U6 snRNA-associated Sm-like protein LSm2
MVDRGVAISVELKNGVIIQGKLSYVDKHLNFNLYDINVDIKKYPQFVRRSRLTKITQKTCFIRGSTVMYVHIPPSEMDTDLVEEAFKRAREAN